MLEKLQIVKQRFDEVSDLINQPGKGLQDVYWVDAKFIEEVRP